MHEAGSMDMRAIAKEARKNIVQMVTTGKSSHVGTALSCVEILVALYFSVMRIDPANPSDPNRDRFILSKGHGCSALYAVLAEKGFFPKARLSRFYLDGGIPGHATLNCLPGVEASTGSLGHGLSLGLGMAMAAKIDERSYRTFVLLGDGECDEGSVWEAAMLAGHMKLDNLVAIVDYNKLQSFGYTKDVIDLEPFAKKWESFGWSAVEVDGHDLVALYKTLSHPRKGKPAVIIAHTIKGRGISYMENKLEWHYKSPTTEQEKQALEELG
jgi:transketolase